MHVWTDPTTTKVSIIVTCLPLERIFTMISLDFPAINVYCSYFIVNANLISEAYPAEHTLSRQSERFETSSSLKPKPKWQQQSGRIQQKLQLKCTAVAELRVSPVPHPTGRNVRVLYGLKSS